MIAEDAQEVSLRRESRAEGLVADTEGSSLRRDLQAEDFLFEAPPDLGARRGGRALPIDQRASLPPPRQRDAEGSFDGFGLEVN